MKQQQLFKGQDGDLLAADFRALSQHPFALELSAPVTTLGLGPPSPDEEGAAFPCLKAGGCL